MENIITGKVNIFGIDIDRIDYGILLSKIFIAIENNEKISVSYANVHNLNILYNNPDLQTIISGFDIIHPDGIGAYLASKFLYRNTGIKRMTGSDFYPLLAAEGIKRGWRFYFLGHDDQTLEKIQKVYPDLDISGYSEGYNFDTGTVINKINSSGTDVLITGLGFPKQEKWIYDNKEKLKCNVILAAGDGIKVFAGTKIRGNAILRKIGLEWLIRLLSDPQKYWRRYLIGNPQFLYRIIKTKISKFNK